MTGVIETQKRFMRQKGRFASNKRLYVSHKSFTRRWRTTCSQARRPEVACGVSRWASMAVYHPLEVPRLIDECFESFLDTAATITDPFERAFFALVHLAYLRQGQR